MGVVTLDNMLPLKGTSLFGVRHWIYYPHIQIYIRLNVKYFEGIVHNTIEIANVEVDEQHRGQGVFTEYYNKIVQIAKEHNRAICVENVLTPRFRQFFIDRGFKPDPNSTFSYIQYNNENTKAHHQIR